MGKGSVALWNGSPPHLTSSYLTLPLLTSFHLSSVASWEIPIHPIQICNAILTPLPASNDARSMRRDCVISRILTIRGVDVGAGRADGYEKGRLALR